MTISGRVINYHEGVITLELDDRYEFKPNQPTELKFKARDCNQELRSLLWVFMAYLGKQLGLSSRQTYDMLKYESGLTREVELPDGRVITIPLSASNGAIDNNGLGEFLRFCELWAIEQGFDIEPYIARHRQIRRERGKE